MKKKSIAMDSPRVEKYKPSLHVEGKQAQAIHKSAPVGKTVKMVVHAKVTNHGISTYNGNQPTASLEVQKMVPMGSKTSGSHKAPSRASSVPKAKDPDAKYEKGMSPRQKSDFVKKDAKRDSQLSKAIKDKK